MTIKTSLTNQTLSDYSFTEDVPTLDPSDMSGSTGNISFTTPAITDYQFLRNQQFDLSDSRFGSVIGTVGTLSNDESGTLTVGGELLLRRLTAIVTIPPKYLASTAACMDAALGLVGFVSSGLPSTGTDSFPGWRGTVFDYVKHFCAVYRKEYYVRKAFPNTIFFRPIRSNSLSVLGTSSFKDDLNDQSLAQAAEVVVHRYLVPGTISSNVEFTPAYAESEPQILTVEAGETTEYEIRINGWASSVNQPVAMDYVSPGEQTGLGSYCVAGNDGLPVSAAQWTAFGGSVAVEIEEDPSVLKVTVTAPSKSSLLGSDGVTDRFGPYSIGATAVLDNTFYNSLHITGKGIRTTKSTISCPTGVATDITVEEVGATVDNPFVSSESIAWDIAAATAGSFAGPKHSFSMSVVPTGTEVEDVLGSTFQRGAFKFRTESVSVSPGGMTTSGNSDVSLGDFDTLWAGRTLGDFDTMWSGKTCGQHAAAPLWEA